MLMTVDTSSHPTHGPIRILQLSPGITVKSLGYSLWSNILTIFRYLVHDEMWRVERESVLFKSGFWNLHLAFFLAEALMKITGAYPAFMRPRKWSIASVSVLLFTSGDFYSLRKLQWFSPWCFRNSRAISSHLGLGVRGTFPSFRSSMLIRHNLFFLSSQDSLGASVQTSKNLYNNVANQHPNSILALNHETIGISTTSLSLL